ncbi:MAG: hypothetical protein OXB84_08035 [Halobacteriovoraceae bacterium]|nr:hypothetical protein [Halobacteriovoraceae bacterium]
MNFINKALLTRSLFIFSPAGAFDDGSSKMVYLDKERKNKRMVVKY